MNINSSPLTEDVIVENEEGDIENSQISPDFILKAAQAVEGKMAEGKDKIPFSLRKSAEDAVSEYNVKVNGNIYSLGVNKWDGVFKRMKHELENTSTVLQAGSIEIIEQDFTIEMESYLQDEGFDVTVTDEEIGGPDAEEAQEFIEEKFGV